ncbi:pde-4, partial [Symbiodinium sp. CCMP2456]
FCTNAGHDLALTYNDRSVLENMHSATCFHLMKGFGCDVLASASREKRAQYREHIVGLILATDMATHFDFLGKFRVRRDCTEFNVQ